LKPAETLALLLLGALWGASYVFIRVAAPVIGPVLLIEVRLLLAAAALILYAAARGQRPITFDRWRSFLVLGAVNAAAPFTLVAFAELRLPASLAAILSATNPMFTAPIAAVVLHEVVGLRRFLGLVLGFCGVGIVVGWSTLPMSPVVLVSIAGVLLSAVCFASGGVYSRAVFPDTPSVTLATMQQLSAAALLLPLTLILVAARPPAAPPSGSVILAVLALAVGSTSIAYLLYFYLLNHAGPTRTHTTSFLVPVFGVIWGAAFLHEPVPLGVIGGAFVIGIGLVLVLSQAGRSKSPEEPFGGHVEPAEP